MKTVDPRYVRWGAWGLSVAAFAVSFVAWGQGYQWQLSGLSLYQFFPLLGLTAFSLMWSHYIAAVMRQYVGAEAAVLHSYFEITSAAVLVAILLHPGLLGWQLWRDGLGLPPGSYKLYVGVAGYTWVLVGLTAFVIFLSYELRRFFGKRPWWRFVQYASDVAMFLIFFHGLRLGTHLRQGWFRGVWFFYGITLAGALLYMYVLKPRQQQIAKTS